MIRPGRRPIISPMKPNQPFRRYVIVDRREDRAGIRHLGIARLVGVLDVASRPAAEAAKTARS
jgi:hypothetical protein